MLYWVNDEFFEGANELRAAFEAHFRDPQSHDQRHQIWNYWYVPGHYTYLRAMADTVLPKVVVDRFVERVRAWSLQRLGLGAISRPVLSFYVNGCAQTLHNDADNGRFGYVYSITRWDQRSFSGGETILFPEEDYWRSERIVKPAGGVDLYTLVPAQFNRLLVFDDRLIHGVQTVQGQMNPLEARVVLHGHIEENGIHISGGLSHEAVIDAWQEKVDELESILAGFEAAYSGVVSLRLIVNCDGQIAECTTLLNSLRPVSRSADATTHVLNAIESWGRGIVLPRAVEPTTIYLPLALGAAERDRALPM